MEQILVSADRISELVNFWKKMLDPSRNKVNKTFINDSLFFPVHPTALATAAKNRMVRIAVDSGTIVGAIIGFTPTLKIDDARFGEIVHSAYSIVGDATFVMPIFVVDSQYDHTTICTDLFISLHSHVSTLSWPHSRRGSYYSTFIFPVSTNNTGIQLLYRNVMGFELEDTFITEKNKKMSFYRSYIE